MIDPREGPARPATPAADPAADRTGADDQQDPVRGDCRTDAAARAAADVTRLLAGALGLHRAVELAERSQREADGTGRG